MADSALTDFSLANMDSWWTPSNAGDTYFGGDDVPQYLNDYDRFGYTGVDWEQAQKYGYKGAIPVAAGQENVPQQFGDPKQELADWMKTSGYTYGVQPRLNGGQTNAWFAPGGKEISGTRRYFEGGDPMFGLASSMLAGAGGQFLGGLNGLGAIGSGAFAGGASAGMNNPSLSSIVKGAATGATGAGLAPDVAGMTGLGNGTLGQVVNGAVKSGITAAIGGGDIGKSALQGGIYSGINSLGSGGGQVSDTFGQDYSRAPWATSSPSLASESAGMSYAPWTGGAISSAPQEDDWGSGQLGEFANSLFGAGKSALSAIGGPKGLGDLASGLMGAYSGYKRQRMAKDYLRQMGANRGSYEEQMRKNLMAKDAQRGRRSNIGGREVELQARLAELDSRNAPAFAQLSDARIGGLEQMLASGLRYGNKREWFGPSGGYDPASSAAVGPGLSVPGYTPPPMANSWDYSLDPTRRQRLGGY